MTMVQEAYAPIPIGADGSYTLKNSRNIGGFLAAADGTIAVADPSGATVVAATAVTAGAYLPIPARFSENGATVTLAGSASGTLFIG